MKRTMNGAIRAAGSLALVGGIIMAAAMPAAAASPNEAYSVLAQGSILNVGPLFEATFPGTSPVTAVSLSAPPLITAGVITNTADATDASSDLANVDATLLATVGLTADAVHSSCTFDTDTATVTGTTTIANGVLSLLLRNVTLDANPTVNDTLVGIGRLVSVTLNQQTTALDGTLTVNAIAITLLGTGQTITIGTSICNAASLAPVPILPGKALTITMGGLGALLLGGVVYQVSRRRRLVTAR